ncbi:hypothetical protein D3C72_1516640 [compost metagenome]
MRARPQCQLTFLQDAVAQEIGESVRVARAADDLWQAQHGTASRAGHQGFHGTLVLEIGRVLLGVDHVAAAEIDQPLLAIGQMLRQHGALARERHCVGFVRIGDARSENDGRIVLCVARCERTGYQSRTDDHRMGAEGRRGEEIVCMSMARP